MPLRVTRRNVQGGFRDATGFHPFRSSSDYDPELAGDDYGARTDGTGFKRYTRTRKTEAAKKRRRKTAAKPHRKATQSKSKKRRNPTGKEPNEAKLLAQASKPGNNIRTMARIQQQAHDWGLYRVSAVVNDWMRRVGATQMEMELYWRKRNPRRKSASLLRPAHGKESPRVRKALTKYVRGKSNPSTPYYSKERAMKAAREFRALGQNAKVTSKWEGNQKVYWVHNSPKPKAKNPGKGRTVKVLGYEVRKGSKRHQKLLAQKKQFGDIQRSETGRGRKNPRPGGSKLYEVRIPRTASDIGYTLTIRAKTKRTARAEAKSYCATSFSKKTGKPKSAYRLPSTTKVTEVR